MNRSSHKRRPVAHTPHLDLVSVCVQVGAVDAVVDEGDLMGRGQSRSAIYTFPMPTYLDSFRHSATRQLIV